MSAVPTTLPVQATRAVGPKLAEAERTLTRTEQKILDGIMDPALRHSTQPVFCKAVGVGATRYWQIMKDPWFQEQRRSLLRSIIQRQAMTFVEAAAKTAATPGRDGFQDRRLLLSMTGDHIERRQHNHDVTGRIVVGVVGVSLDELG